MSQLRAALADPAAPVPEGARRMTVDERTEQVAMVAMALEKQVGGVGKSHKQEGDVCMVHGGCMHDCMRVARRRAVGACGPVV